MIARCLLDGRDVTGVTLEGVTITRGRTSIYADPSPGVAVATLLSGDVDPAAWQGVSGYVDAYEDTWRGLTAAARVGVPLVIETLGESGYVDAYEDTWRGAGTTRFTGTVTAVDYTPGQLQVTAVDDMERLGRQYVTVKRPQESDLSRASAYCRQAGIQLRYTGTYTTDLLPAEPKDDPATLLDALISTADNTDAQLFTDRGGDTWWRRRDTPPSVFVTLPGDCTLTDDMEVTSELGYVYNVQRVQWGDPRQVTERVNQASITQYGRREWKTYTTDLVTAQAAAALADYWLAIDTNVTYLVQDVSVVITAEDPDAWHHAADGIDLYAIVTVPQLPAGSPIPSYSATVLGYTERIDATARFMQLHLAPPTYMKGSTSWR